MNLIIWFISLFNKELTTARMVKLYKILHPFSEIITSVDLASDDGDKSCTIIATRYNDVIYIREVIYGDGAV